MFVRETMKVIANTVFSVLLILIFILFSGCSKDKKPAESMILSQTDIDLLVEHKKQIDRITKKYDRTLSKTKMQDRPEVVKKGKAEINKYLKRHQLHPTFFMRKSKKILKGYIAFYKTDDAAIERRRKILEKQNLSKEELKSNIKAFKKENERTFRELTSDLTDYEIELIRANLSKLSTVVNL